MTRLKRTGPTRKPSRLAPKTEATRNRVKLRGLVIWLQTRLQASDPRPIPARYAPRRKAKLFASPPVVKENRRYHTISYPSEINPATAATRRASGKPMPEEFSRADSACFSRSLIKFGSALRGWRIPDADLADTKCHARTLAPTTAFNTAARATVFVSPSQRIRKNPAQKQAEAEPSVFAAYSAPTDVPTLCETRTPWDTRIGSVEPISTVGRTTSAKAISPVCSGGEPAVNSAAQ
jgi:hypothetical protein